MMTVAGYQRVNLNDRTYEVTWYHSPSGLFGLVHVLTKKGPRTLNGRGRAYRPLLIRAVLDAARADDDAFRVAVGMLPVHMLP